MKRAFIASGPWVRALVTLNLALISLVAGVLVIFSWPSMLASHAQGEAGKVYTPVQLAPEPTPTPGPPPQFVKNVPLPKAQCPNAAGFNRVSGFMYIVNIYSDNVSVFRDQEFMVDILTGEWPRGITSDPNSSRSWVTNLHSGVSLIDGAKQIGLVPRDYEPYSLTFNPVNGYVYVTDLDSKIQVIDGAQLVTTIKVADPQTGEKAGWMLSIVADPRTGLVYASSWEYGRLFVIEGTTVIDSMQLGAGPVNMAFDEVRGLLYVAHSMPNAFYPSEVSVVDVESLTVTYVDTLPGQIGSARDVAVDVKSGFAYVSNPDHDSVTILNGTMIVGTIALGDQPWGIGINPNNGYVFVTNRRSNEVSILRNGALLDTVQVQGEEPWAVGVDTNNNDIYIANRGAGDSSSGCRNASVTILH